MVIGFFIIRINYFPKIAAISFCGKKKQIWSIFCYQFFSFHISFFIGLKLIIISDFISFLHNFEKYQVETISCHQYPKVYQLICEALKIFWNLHAKLKVLPIYNSLALPWP